ncbi:SLC25A40 [Branchiostoma lanceolatum]|uniref:SLC25A40 protein n=1 Tax=Branchiostoma lanceolatum TaxID=7740 RepID=A0A8J9YTD4_BRALA|nr:SLC25A40 [Branchiostoma lanceolatum]
MARRGHATTTRITPLQQMAASCSGAFLTSLFVTPLDVVKIRLQAQEKPFAKGNCFLYCNGLMDHLCVCLNGNSTSAIRPWYRMPGKFNGTLDAFVQISKKEGLKSLWSGLPPTLIMAVPATVVYFTAYDNLKEAMGFVPGKKNYTVPIVAGSIARIIAVTAISPLELIRTKMQSKKLTYQELKSCIRSSVQSGGVLSLYRGWGPTVLRDVPFSALYWLNYEYFKSELCEIYHTEEPTLVMSFFAGATSGTIAAVLTLPFDVIKTHRQIEMGEMETRQNCYQACGRSLAFTNCLCIQQERLHWAPQSSSTFILMRRLWMQNGPKALFAGLTPRVVKVAPACAIMISCYEGFKSFFRRRNEQQRAALTAWE